MTTAVARRRNAAGLGKISTTSALRLISLLSRSIIRPSVVGQPGVWVWVSAVKSLEVVGEGVRDAVVAGVLLGVPPRVGRWVQRRRFVMMMCEATRTSRRG